MTEPRAAVVVEDAERCAPSDHMRPLMRDLSVAPSRFASVCELGAYGADWCYLQAHTTRSLAGID